MTNTKLIHLAEKTVLGTWGQLMRVYPKLVKPCPVVALNARLKTTAGRSFYELRKIDLSVSLFREYPDSFVRDTIPHEVCHQAAWDLFGDGGHGPHWKAVMLSIGVNPKRCHQMVNTAWEAQKAARR